MVIVLSLRAIAGTRRAGDSIFEMENAGNSVHLFAILNRFYRNCPHMFRKDE
jgi:hypothetical protein